MSHSAAFLAKVAELDRLHGLSFRNMALLALALTHSSFSRRTRNKSLEDNERLEFLGDAVLKLLVSDYLYEKYPALSEGRLTKMRAHLVSDATLASLARHLDLGRYLLLSFGEENSGGAERPSNLANAFEAVLGAMYLDRGLGAVRDFFIPLMENQAEQFLSESDIHDYKTFLQELMQRHQCELPAYHVLKEAGPDHNKIFHVEVVVHIAGVSYRGEGHGSSKKIATQTAAKGLVEVLRRETGILAD